ncbi:MAG: hypothetical protein AAF822_13735 [Pseudomonadota bacterium]
MKRTVPASVFLERRSYRRRRMMDAVRLLPVLGAMLLMLPLFWPSGAGPADEAIAMSTAVIYVFVVWLILICAAFGLWRVLWFRRAADLSETDIADDGDAA